MMLNFAAYVFAFLAYYAVGYAFQFGAVADQRRAGKSRRHPDAQSLPVWAAASGDSWAARDFS